MEWYWATLLCRVGGELDVSWDGYFTGPLRARELSYHCMSDSVLLLLVNTWRYRGSL